MNFDGFYLIMALITSFTVTIIAIPSIIHISKLKHLYDVPEERKSHNTNIPTLGGVAIFGGFIIALSLWSDMGELRMLQYILAASCVLFLVGAKDDIVNLDAHKKFIGQLIASFIVVVMADVRFTSFQDLFPNFDVPYWLSVIISMFTMLVLINAFNLIDGINGLSASMGILISATFGIWFWLNQEHQIAILVASLIGALFAFLRFNLTPARIFMGDTGSLLIGLICGVLAISFTESNIGHHGEGYYVHAAPAVAIGFLAFPLFDLLRAFSLRISKGESPFTPDRNHLHHLLLDLGYSHMQATSLLIGIQFFYIILVLYLQSLDLNSWVIIIILLVLSIIISSFIFSKAESVQTRKQKEVSNQKNPVAVPLD